MWGEYFWLYCVTRQSAGVTGSHTYWHVAGSEQKMMTNFLVAFKPFKQQKTQMSAKQPGVPYTPVFPIIRVLW
jgi:hypothetical protein